MTACCSTDRISQLPIEKPVASIILAHKSRLINTAIETRGAFQGAAATGGLEARRNEERELQSLHEAEGDGVGIIVDDNDRTVEEEQAMELTTDDERRGSGAAWVRGDYTGRGWLSCWLRKDAISRKGPARSCLHAGRCRGELAAEERADDDEAGAELRLARVDDGGKEMLATEEHDTEAEEAALLLAAEERAAEDEAGAELLARTEDPVTGLLAAEDRAAEEDTGAKLLIAEERVSEVDAGTGLRAAEECAAEEDEATLLLGRAGDVATELLLAEDRGAEAEDAGAELLSRAEDAEAEALAVDERAPDEDAEDAILLAQPEDEELELLARDDDTAVPLKWVVLEVQPCVVIDIDGNIDFGGAVETTNQAKSRGIRHRLLPI
ncbi:hypothetical protein B0H10DRAFT_1942724 [Mycena sp. CBHHK59/15]|nr:hypothetical protein B0H10DRAFT_1942724 [Mycena sp. CBHHK59/15]